MPNDKYQAASQIYTGGKEEQYYSRYSPTIDLDLAKARTNDGRLEETIPNPIEQQSPYHEPLHAPPPRQKSPSKSRKRSRSRTRSGTRKTGQAKSKSKIESPYYITSHEFGNVRNNNASSAPRSKPRSNAKSLPPPFKSNILERVTAENIHARTNPVDFNLRDFVPRVKKDIQSPTQISIQERARDRSLDKTHGSDRNKTSYNGRNDHSSRAKSEPRKIANSSSELSCADTSEKSNMSPSFTFVSNKNTSPYASVTQFEREKLSKNSSAKDSHSSNDKVKKKENFVQKVISSTKQRPYSDNKSIKSIDSNSSIFDHKGNSPDIDKQIHNRKSPSKMLEKLVVQDKQNRIRYSNKADQVYEEVKRPNTKPNNTNNVKNTTRNSTLNENTNRDISVPNILYPSPQMKKRIKAHDRKTVYMRSDQSPPPKLPSSQPQTSPIPFRSRPLTQYDSPIEASTRNPSDVKNHFDISKKSPKSYTVTKHENAKLTVQAPIDETSIKSNEQMTKGSSKKSPTVKKSETCNTPNRVPSHTSEKSNTKSLKPQKPHVKSENVPKHSPSHNTVKDESDEKVSDGFVGNNQYNNEKCANPDLIPISGSDETSGHDQRYVHSNSNTAVKKDFIVRSSKKNIPVNGEMNSSTQFVTKDVPDNDSEKDSLSINTNVSATKPNNDHTLRNGTAADPPMHKQMNNDTHSTSKGVFQRKRDKENRAQSPETQKQQLVSPSSAKADKEVPNKKDEIGNQCHDNKRGEENPNRQRLAKDTTKQRKDTYVIKFPAKENASNDKNQYPLPSWSDQSWRNATFVSKRAQQNTRNSKKAKSDKEESEDLKKADCSKQNENQKPCLNSIDENSGIQEFPSLEEPTMIEPTQYDIDEEPEEMDLASRIKYNLPPAGFQHGVIPKETLPPFMEVRPNIIKPNKIDQIVKREPVKSPPPFSFRAVRIKKKDNTAVESDGALKLGPCEQATKPDIAVDPDKEIPSPCSKQPSQSMDMVELCASNSMGSVCESVCVPLNPPEVRKSKSSSSLSEISTGKPTHPFYRQRTRKRMCYGQSSTSRQGERNRGGGFDDPCLRYVIDHDNSTGLFGALSRVSRTR